MTRDTQTVEDLRSALIAAFNRWYEAKRTDEAESAINLFEIYIHEALDRLLAAVRAEHQQEIETLAKINHDLCDALTRENKRAEAAEQQLALLQHERIQDVKDQEKDHNAGLIDANDTGHGDTLLRLNK